MDREEIIAHLVKIKKRLGVNDLFIGQSYSRDQEARALDIVIRELKEREEIGKRENVEL